MVDVPRFPLLQLPNDERIEVLRQMEFINLIKVSFLSKKAKESVISRKFKAESVLVFVNDDISIAPFYARGVPFHRFHLFMEQADDGPKTVKKPTHINFSESVPVENQEYNVSKVHEWKNEKFEVQDWLDHFHTIFHCKTKGIIFHQDAFDFDSVYQHFKNPDELSICDTGNVDYNNRVLKSLVPSKNIFVDSTVFDNLRVPRNLMIQNFGIFEAFDEPLRESFTLDDLLCNNSKQVLLINILFSQKDINRFFKLWISGSNRRLERLAVHFFNREVPTLDALVKGIKHISLPDDHIMYYIPYHRRKQWAVKGGRDIMRKDGTKGTVSIQDSPHGDLFVNFYIWHDHNSI